MAKKPKAKAKDKVVEEQPKSNVRENISSFLSSRIEKAEATSGMVANTSKHLDPQSTGSLCVDWLFNGGIFNGFASISGMEQSGKSTLLFSTISSGLKSNFLFSSVIDSEGTLTDDYLANIARQQGIDLPYLSSIGRSFQYYKESVIENVFDYMVNLLNGLPRKIWSPEAKTWTYSFPKNDQYFKDLMERYEVKPDRSLTTAKAFVCPTDHSGIEAAFYVDSFAAMLTESDEESGERSKIRAAEAQAFSNHLKRVASKFGNRGCMLFGTNQLRKIPGQVYGSPTYMPGGEALKFYSGQRAEASTRSSGFHQGLSKYDKDARGVTEPSVIGDGKDRYSYKQITNTKNKPGNPGKQTWVRVWQADHMGNAHGIDPYFDVFWYLMETGQIKKAKREKGRQYYTFNLKSSVGNNRAKLLNSLEPFSELDLKTLVLSEVFGGKPLISKALTAMGLSTKVGLRKSLFDQVKNDPTVRALKNGKSKESDNDDDYEDEDGKKEL